MKKRNCDIKADSKLKIILSKHKYGKIHSVFENSFNIKFEDELINFSYKADYIASLGFNIKNLNKIPIKQNEIALISDEKIIIYSNINYELDIQNIEFVDLSPTFIDKKDTEEFINIINIHDICKKMGIEVNDKLIQIVKNLNNEEKYKTSIDYLIGRGLGLTPSGDDIICGFMFSHIILGKKYPFKEYIDIAKNKTTDISKHNLKSINKGYFNSILKNLNLSIKNRDKIQILNSINNILSYGHTSGADLIFGIWYGFKF